MRPTLPFQDPRHFEILRADVMCRLFGWKASPSANRYRLLRTLGAGGCGVVYEGWDSQLDRAVAIKIVGTDGEGPRHRQLLREARAVAEIDHPNVVELYDVVSAGPQSVMLVMQLLGGVTLGAWLRRRPHWRAIVEAFTLAGRGLVAAHQRGIVHRDFKPSNAMIDASGAVHILDFGLARWISDDHAPAASDPDGVAGTPAYMAPEQLGGHTVGPSADQFSFCVALWEALSGAHPFPQLDPHARLLAIERGPTSAWTRGPNKLRAVLARGLRPQPAARWPDMQTLLAEVAAAAAPRRSLALAGTLATAAASAILGLVIATPPCEAAAARDDADERSDVRAALIAGNPADGARDWEIVAHELDAFATARARLAEQACDSEPAALQTCEDVGGEAIAAALDRTAIDPSRAPAFAPRWRQSCAEPEASAGDAGMDGARLVWARALRDAGQPALALAVLDPDAAAQVATAPTPRAIASLALRGELEADLGAIAAAESDLLQAWYASEGHGHAALAAGVAGELAMLYGVDRALPVRGLQWLRHGVAALHRIGRPAPDEAALRVREGTLRDLQADPSARSIVVAALADVQALFGEGHPRTIEATVAAAAVELRAGAYDDALAAFAAARRAVVGRHGTDHLRAAMIDINVGSVVGDDARAEAMLRHAIEVLSLRLGPAHASVGTAFEVLGHRLHTAGRSDEAARALASAIAIYEQALGAEHPNVANAIDLLAGVALDRGDLAQAEALYQSAHDRRRAALGDRHPLVTGSLANVGVLQRLRGRPADALATAIEVLRRVQGEPANDERTARAHSEIAAAELALGRPAVARSHASVALALRIAPTGRNDDALAWTWLTLGEIDLALERPDRASAELAEAVRAYRASRGATHFWVAHALVAQAEAELALRRFGDAADLAQRAITIYEAGDAGRSNLGRARRVLRAAGSRRSSV